MNEKQFDLFQQSIQWAVDYQRDRDEGHQHDSHDHNQGLWVYGKVDREKTLTIHNFYYHPVCGTSCCLAGKAVILHGDTPIVTAGAVTGNVTMCVTEDERLMSIADRATELFGISDGQANLMFAGSNDADELVRRGTSVASMHGHTLTVI